LSAQGAKRDRQKRKSVLPDKRHRLSGRRAKSKAAGNHPGRDCPQAQTR
jgi:hypothetical protein